MKSRVKLKPGQRGTKKLVEQYGDALVCVRYRYDRASGKQFKTVELIVSEHHWAPPAKFSDSALVRLKINYSEKKLQEETKAAGGRWDPKQQVWLVRYGCIAGTKLEKFILLETSDK